MIQQFYHQKLQWRVLVFFSSESSVFLKDSYRCTSFNVRNFIGDLNALLPENTLSKLYALSELLPQKNIIKVAVSKKALSQYLLLIYSSTQSSKEIPFSMYLYFLKKTFVGNNFHFLFCFYYEYMVPENNLFNIISFLSIQLLSE